MPALLLLTGPSAGKRFVVTEEAIVGRSPSCQIPIEDEKASRRHARIFVRDGQARVTDLGSRNGTVVNDQKVEGEAILLPGDRVQIGATSLLFEPPTKASLADREAAAVRAMAVEEVLPVAGTEGALLAGAVALVGTTSEAMVLRRVAEEATRSSESDLGAALLGGVAGLVTAAVVGAENVDVPRRLAQEALEQRNVVVSGGMLVAPLIASGGAPFGVLYVERATPFAQKDASVVASLARMAGEQLAAIRARASEGEAPKVELVGSSKPFRRSVEQARRAAAGGDSVWIHGEVGSGRMQMARLIHARSARALGPLVVVDCRHGAARLDEELFGRPSGTGVPPLTSALIRADGGTLVLRELERMPRALSERLAKLLQRRSAPARQGGEEPVDVRLIATSSHSTKELAGKAALEVQLIDELSKLQIHCLPLRDRQTDVAELFTAFAGAVAAGTASAPPRLSPDALRLLCEYRWPGNVRELELFAEHAALLHPGREVSALDLPPEVHQKPGQPSERASGQTLGELVGRLERDAISEALREAGGKKIRAAAVLGISRPTLDKKIQDYGLTVTKVRRR